VTGSSIRVRYYCGLYVGAPKWHGTESYEPGECGGEGEIEVDLDEWNDGSVSIKCEACGQAIHQSEDHLEPV
jgi:hypothetical protein